MVSLDLPKDSSISLLTPLESQMLAVKNRIQSEQPKDKTMAEYKVERSRVKKEEIDEWTHKKNIFLINKRYYVNQFMKNYHKLKAHAIERQRKSNSKFGYLCIKIC